MPHTNTILIVEDDINLRNDLCETLRNASYKVLEAKDARSALLLLQHNVINLIISDVQMPDMDGLTLLQSIKDEFSGIPFVLITAYGSVPKAVEAIRAGAADYIIKPFEENVLLEIAERLSNNTQESSNMVIADPKSKHVANLCRRVAASNATVMISGESGTGKEVYSQYIHSYSDRNDKPFIAINCAAIPEQMLESILFGYEKGAFTGAYASRPGKFEQANNGTILLDEISEMDLGLQAKLLRVIQEKEVERLGSNKVIPLDVRIIATTNRNLKEEVVNGRFREDLYYRLNVFPITLPSLKDRPEDIIPLASQFIQHYQPDTAITLSPCAKEQLIAHSWDGNVRELENIIQRALILNSTMAITAKDLMFEAMDQIVMPSSINVVPFQNSSPLESDLKTREKEIIIDAISSNNNRTEAAKKLGISPRTLRYKLAQFRKEGIAIPA